MPSDSGAQPFQTAPGSGTVWPGDGVPPFRSDYLLQENETYFYMDEFNHEEILKVYQSCCM